jgi:hypothetical protein
MKAIRCVLYSGFGCTCDPGVSCASTDASVIARESGTNASSMTTVLLPVPFMPMTYQSSITWPSERGTMNDSATGGSDSSRKAPQPSQFARSTPD